MSCMPAVGSMFVDHCIDILFFPNPLGISPIFDVGILYSTLKCPVVLHYQLALYFLLGSKFQWSEYRLRTESFKVLCGIPLRIIWTSLPIFTLKKSYFKNTSLFFFSDLACSCGLGKVTVGNGVFIQSLLVLFTAPKRHF